jgi:hypothetical protein
MSKWHLQTRQFLLPKNGHSLSECEDVIGINEGGGRFAIADGATEAFDARSWARRLACNWVKVDSGALTPEDFLLWVTNEGRLLQDSWSNLDLSWYAEEKASSGSFAAFVGVQLDLESLEPCWKAIALGDSCLIHCRGKKILSALPISEPERFNAMPVLVPSHGSMQAAALQRVTVGCGSIEHGDVVLLLSDAASAWYLKLRETDESTRFDFDRLLEGVRNCEVAQLFESERLAGRIKNDDIAVIRIQVEES